MDQIKELHCVGELSCDDVELDEISFVGLSSVTNQSTIVRTEFVSVRILQRKVEISEIQSESHLTLVLEGRNYVRQFKVSNDLEFCSAGPFSVFLHLPNICNWYLHFKSTAKLMEFRSVLSTILRGRQHSEISAEDDHVSDLLLDESYSEHVFLDDSMKFAEDQPAILIEDDSPLSTLYAVAEKVETHGMKRKGESVDLDERPDGAVIKNPAHRQPKKSTKSSAVKNKTLYDWISHKFGNSPSAVPRAGSKTPHSVQTSVVKWIEETSCTVTIPDIVVKANDFIRESGDRFIPTERWAARLSIRFGLTDYLSCPIEEVLKLAEIPEAPFMAVKAFERSKDRQLPWCFRKQIVEFALRTSVRGAAALFGLPKSTVHEWVTKVNTPAVQTASGRKLGYSKKSDDMVFDWLSREISKGIPPTDRQVQQKARSIIGLEQKSFKASRKWLSAFYFRHNLSSKSPHVVTEEQMPEFDQLNNQDLNLNAILNELLVEFCSMPLEKTSGQIASTADLSDDATSSNRTADDGSVQAT